MDDNRQQAVAFVDAISATPTSHLVFNSFATRTTLTEVQCVVSFGQRPLALLIISPVLAKTLALSLLERVKEYEEKTGVPVKSIAEITSYGKTG